MPTIRVEFFAIPRARAGVASTEIEAGSLREACVELERRFPELAASCLSDGALKPGYLANVNGTEFTGDPHRTLHDGDTLMILSADIGG